MKRIIFCMLKSLLFAYLLSGVCLVVLSFLFYKTGMSEGKLPIIIGVIYFLATFFGGLLMGKSMHQRKFFWGLAVGGVYVLLLLGMSLGIYQEFSGSGGQVFRTLCLCLAGGMLGGMVA